MKFEEGCTDYDLSYYEVYIVSYKVWFLFWKSQFNEALVLLEELDEVFKRSYSVFRFLRSLLLLKLGKYDEAESVYDGKSIFELFDYVCLSFVKFMKHDFSGAKDLLEKRKIHEEGINDISIGVWLYELKWNDFNQKKISFSFNQNEDVTKSLKECVEMKKMIAKWYDKFLLGKVNLYIN